MKSVLLLWCSIAAAGGAEPGLYTRVTYVMGTTATVKVFAGNESSAQAWASDAFAELHRLDDVFTNYRDSELTRLNRDAARGPVPLSADMHELVRLSIEYARKYDGAFDPTVGPAVRAWGFLGDALRIPSPEARGKLRQLIGIENLAFDPGLRTLAFRQPGVELDFGGIAKGYAAEKVARLLESEGVERALVNLGDSSYYALGAPPGQEGWPIAVLDPRRPHGPVEVLELAPHMALSTSGTYGRTFRRGTRVFSHIFDPRTGEPVSGKISATVISASGAESEAAAKAVLLFTPARLRTLRGVDYLRLEARRDGSLARSRQQERYCSTMPCISAKRVTSLVRALNWPMRLSIVISGRNCPRMIPPGCEDECTFK